MRIVFSKHCRESMRERKIKEEDVESVIAKGQKWFSHQDQRHHARMGGIEVVYETESNGEDICKVVTCFYSWFP